MSPEVQKPGVSVAPQKWLMSSKKIKFRVQCCTRMFLGWLTTKKKTELKNQKSIPPWPKISYSLSSCIMWNRSSGYMNSKAPCNGSVSAIEPTVYAYYRPQTKLRKGNVFTPVCQLFCSQWGGSAPVHAGTHHPPLGRHPPTADGYCCGRYASYWNAFLVLNNFQCNLGFVYTCRQCNRFSSRLENGLNAVLWCCLHLTSKR